jgi:hypothetical protein
MKLWIFDFLKKLFEAQNRYVLLCIANFWRGLKSASKRHNIAEQDLRLHCQILEKMIEDVFSLETMDDPQLVLQVLTYSTRTVVDEANVGNEIEVHDDDETMPYKRGEIVSISTVGDKDRYKITFDKSTNTNKFLNRGEFSNKEMMDSYSKDYWINAMTLQDKQFLGYCLSIRLKSVFGCHAISQIINQLLWGHITANMDHYRHYR